MPLRSTVSPALCLILLLISASPLRAQYKLPPLDADKLASWPCDIREEIQGLYSPTPLTRVRGVIHLFRMGRRAGPAVMFLRVAISYGSGMEPPAECSPLSAGSAEGNDEESAARILERRRPDDDQTETGDGSEAGLASWAKVGSTIPWRPKRSIVRRRALSSTTESIRPNRSRTSGRGAGMATHITFSLRTHPTCAGSGQRGR